jgi:hypothetical protein
VDKDAIAEGWRDAKRFLRRYAVRTRADIRPEAWAHSCGIEIIEDDLDGAAAQLIRIGDVVQIVLSSKVAESGTRRFTIAHELDHHIKKHPSPTPTMMCTPKAARRGDDNEHKLETHANAFAGAVLLPDFLVRRQCEVSPVSLDVPYRLAKDYDVSILTSAIRFAELTSERCAAVFSKDGVIEWAVPSATFTREIRRGKRLDRESVAWDFYATGQLDEQPQLVPAAAWFDTTASVDIVEHSICSRAHRTVLSLLWVPEAVGARLGMP